MYSVNYIAEKIMEKYKFLTMTDSGELLVRVGGVYEGHGEARVKEEIKLNFPGAIDSKVIGYIRGIHLATHEIFNTPPELLPVKNGVLNLITGQLRPYNDDDYFIFQLPVEYDPHADCPMWKKFISEVVHPQDAATLQEWAGYNLWRGVPVEKSIILIGDGSNGKSTFLSTLISVLGKDNVSNLSLQHLTGRRRRTNSSSLYGKLANVYEDLPKYIGSLKTILTSHDKLIRKKKFYGSFNFTNYAKFSFSASALPIILNDSFFRNWLIISFPYAFGRVQWAKAPADPLLERKLKTELPGILNWLLEGLKRLRENGWEFSVSYSTEAAKHYWVLKHDQIKAFVEDVVAKGCVGVTTGKLYGAYVEYCNILRLSAHSKIHFFKKLIQLGVYTNNDIVRRTVAGKQERIILGLCLKPKAEWPILLNETETPQFDIFKEIHEQYKRRADRIALAGFEGLFKLMKEINGDTPETNKDIEFLKDILGPEPPQPTWCGADEDQLVSDLIAEIMDIYRAEMLDAEERTGKASIMPVEDREDYVREKLEENFSDLPSRVKNEVVEGALKENWNYRKGGWNDYKRGASI